MVVCWGLEFDGGGVMVAEGERVGRLLEVRGGGVGVSATRERDGRQARTKQQ